MSLCGPARDSRAAAEEDRQKLRGKPEAEQCAEMRQLRQQHRQPGAAAQVACLGTSHLRQVRLPAADKHILRRVVGKRPAGDGALVNLPTPLRRPCAMDVDRAVSHRISSKRPAPLCAQTATLAGGETTGRRGRRRLGTPNGGRQNAACETREGQHRTQG